MTKLLNKNNYLEPKFSSEKEECLYLRKKVLFLTKHSEELAELVTKVSSQNPSSIDLKNNFLLIIKLTLKIIFAKIIKIVINNQRLKRLAKKILNYFPFLKKRLKYFHRTSN